MFGEGIWQRFGVQGTKFCRLELCHGWGTGQSGSWGQHSLPLDSLNPCPSTQGYTEVPPEVTLTACAGGFLRGLGEQLKGPPPPEGGSLKHSFSHHLFTKHLLSICAILDPELGPGRPR